MTELERTQRGEEARPHAPLRRWTRGVHLPAGGELPASQAWLGRLYAGDLVPREKKPMVVDTRRSLGPYMVSIDDDPLVVLDACGQIATLTPGFGNEHVVAALVDGRFGGCLWVNPDTTVTTRPELAGYARALRARAPAGLDHVCFVAAGGAEANEKALWLARLHAPGGAARRKVLAFRQGFHGRTWVALGATWNPTKRGPFEMAGYEAVFADLSADGIARALDEHGDEIYAAIVEPMMAEGGDVYLDAARLRALRDATRARGIPLIADEVQTGMGTGGTFSWWERLGLGREADSAPDLMTLAKKAQLGVVLSRWPDPAPAPVHVASALRGWIHLEHQHEQWAVAEPIARRLQDLARAHADKVAHPRCAGTTFAFDLPSPDAVKAFIAQRLQRGLMTYQAGSHTIRFRLGAAWSARELDDLFARIGQALERLEDPDATGWPAKGRRRASFAGVVRPVVEADWAPILALQRQVYEPARQTSEAELRLAAREGCARVAEGMDGELLGCCFALPLELASAPAGQTGALDGPAQDPTHGAGTTLYSSDLTVAPQARGRGVGRALKEAQIAWAQEAGYASITGRNRVGATDAMMTLNRSYGALELARYGEQYEGDAVTVYYRIPLRPPRVRPAQVPSGGPALDLASGLQVPFAGGAPGLARRELVGPCASKLNLSNYATPDLVMYLEHLRAILPRGTAHLYVTSSRDETVDKCLRALRVTRPAAQVALGLDGGYVGHTTAAARSLSDPEGFPAPFGLYDWPRLPHPARAGIEATVSALRERVEAVGPDAVFGLFAEAVGERSGEVLTPEDGARLSAACRELGVPLVLVETASGLYRGAAGAAWAVDAWPEGAAPDAVLWYPGGQLGHVFVSDALYVGKPLTLISTWDGDELCMIRTHEALRAAWPLDLSALAQATDRLARTLAETFGGTAGGAGLYRTVRVPARCVEPLDQAALAAGARLGRGAPGVRVLAPALDTAAHAVEAARRRIVAQAPTVAAHAASTSGGEG